MLIENVKIAVFENSSIRAIYVSPQRRAWTERPRGSIVTNAAMIWTLLCVAADVNIRETTNIAGKDNVICNQLSRRGLNPKLTIKQHSAKLGVGGGRVIDAQEDATKMALLRLCSPDVVIESDIQFTRFWGRKRCCCCPYSKNNFPYPFPTSNRRDPVLG